jgi:hypothetical protein
MGVVSHLSLILQLSWESYFLYFPTTIPIINTLLHSTCYASLSISIKLAWMRNFSRFVLKWRKEIWNSLMKMQWQVSLAFKIRIIMAYL